MGSFDPGFANVGLLMAASRRQRYSPYHGGNSAFSSSETYLYDQVALSTKRQRTQKPSYPQFPKEKPLIASVQAVRKINTNPDRDVFHISLDVRGKGLKIEAGQSIGIQPPLPEGEANWIRYYSVSEIQRDGQGNVTTLGFCVKNYDSDPLLKEKRQKMQPGIDFSKKWRASRYLSQLKPGNDIKLYGPFGKILTMPTVKDANILMIGVGTGVASFPTLLQERYDPAQKRSGKMQVIQVESSPDNAFYDDLFRSPQKTFFQKLRWWDYTYTPLFHRKQPGEDSTSSSPTKLQRYIQQNAKHFVQWLQDPKAYIYSCGPDALNQQLIDTFTQIGNQYHPGSGAQLLETLRANNRWRCETKPIFFEQLRNEGLADYAPPRPPSSSEISNEPDEESEVRAQSSAKKSPRLVQFDEHQLKRFEQAREIKRQQAWNSIYSPTLPS